MPKFLKQHPICIQIEVGGISFSYISVQPNAQPLSADERKYLKNKLARLTGKSHTIAAALVHVYPRALSADTLCQLADLKSETALKSQLNIIRDTFKLYYARTHSHLCYGPQGNTSEDMNEGQHQTLYEDSHQNTTKNQHSNISINTWAIDARQLRDFRANKLLNKSFW
ncbi:hypothetical protein BCU68_09235 [Vibrio sp. 10N.286.49.B3]|uniref:hypothetical protein n=1 Tax=Vibrio sp. 10N.286.49.B3 TaxID=1880855 RepID=UPI000C860809|nr:hypothetical protein [Vibrio sp. 10N.286.49.B3]PMH45968.1 hypothetical protein BCU68_09235 [Vibrio sp. 10N.286.49.B3]